MIRGKSLIVGSVVAVLFVLGGGSSALAAEQGSAGVLSIQKKVEREVMRSQNTLKLPVDSVLCKHEAARDNRSYKKLLRAFKCRVRYSFGSDHWERDWADPAGDVWMGESVRSPWYNGDWYVDCRQTESKGFCLKLGKRQVVSCGSGVDYPKGYCHSVVYGRVDLKTGKAPRGANPQIISTKATTGDLGRIVGTGGCYLRDGIMPPCAPDVPVTVGTGKFTTRTDTRVLTFGEVAVRASELEAGVPGTAEVSLQVKLDGTDAGPKRTVQLTGDDRIEIPFEQRFFLAEGVHEVSVEISGRGFDHLNVNGESARLKVFAARVGK